MEIRVFIGLVFVFLIGIVIVGGGLVINFVLFSSFCLIFKFFVMIIDFDGFVLKM